MFIYWFNFVINFWNCEGFLKLGIFVNNILIGFVLFDFFFCKINIDFCVFLFLNKVGGKFKNVCIFVFVVIYFLSCFICLFVKILFGIIRKVYLVFFNVFIVCFINK